MRACVDVAPPFLCCLTPPRRSARALAGVDYLVVPSKVLVQMLHTPTDVGFNDGIHASVPGDDKSPLEKRAAGMAQLVSRHLHADTLTEFEAKERCGDGTPEGETRKLLLAAVTHSADSARAAERHFEKLWPPAGGM